MKENFQSSNNPNDLLVNKAIEELIRAGSKADFLTLMYPDREAAMASNMVDDYIDAIDDGRISIPGIDSKSLLYFFKS
jgi:hypothetical protein